VTDLTCASREELLEIIAQQQAQIAALLVRVEELEAQVQQLQEEIRRLRSGKGGGVEFAVKASRFITHLKRLRDAQAPVATFMQRARLLGEKLGPVLYQLPPSLQRDDQRLRDFLAVLPVGVEHVIEFRHSSWFDDAVFDLLWERGVAFCMADHPSAPAPFAITAPFAYLRFHGSQGAYQGSYGDEDLRVWASRLRLVAPRLKAVYAYFNNDAYAAAVGDARRLRAMLES